VLSRSYKTHARSVLYSSCMYMFHELYNTDFGMSKHVNMAQNAVNEYLVQTEGGFDIFNTSKVEDLTNKLDKLQQQHWKLKIHLHFLEQAVWYNLDEGTSALVRFITHKLKRNALQSLKQKDDKCENTKSDLYNLMENNTMYIEDLDTDIVHELSTARLKELGIEH